MLIDAVAKLFGLFFKGLEFETKLLDHLIMPKHIRARHYMCCKRHLRAQDFGKQTVW